ncbi:uncharacterized protein BDR25DRAFT_364482 [Lindgomyces ingoldianus]|uniref:Uncharacterized protein n=1 Tax=Lindgomyces ingoldianus TaxID=673940 RepID=A0ACB6RGG4_9PLEO|nr:uncharacterized protein BDR25DRAFT_364482 [Lindgomyces ingoldianus]KAF2477597.1 hypothetical protein BDR25DRAFT_364482 [Lindgomyces ingoldianus]
MHDHLHNHPVPGESLFVQSDEELPPPRDPNAGAGLKPNTDSTQPPITAITLPTHPATRNSPKRWNTSHLLVEYKRQSYPNLIANAHILPPNPTEPHQGISFGRQTVMTPKIYTKTVRSVQGLAQGQGLKGHSDSGSMTQSRRTEKLAAALPDPSYHKCNSSFQPNPMPEEVKAPIPKPKALGNPLKSSRSQRSNNLRAYRQPNSNVASLGTKKPLVGQFPYLLLARKPALFRAAPTKTCPLRNTNISPNRISSQGKEISRGLSRTITNVAKDSTTNTSQNLNDMQANRKASAVSNKTSKTRTSESNKNTQSSRKPKTTSILGIRANVATEVIKSKGKTRLHSSLGSLEATETPKQSLGAGSTVVSNRPSKASTFLQVVQHDNPILTLRSPKDETVDRIGLKKFSLELKGDKESSNSEALGRSEQEKPFTPIARCTPVNPYITTHNTTLGITTAPKSTTTFNPESAMLSSTSPVPVQPPLISSKRQTESTSEVKGHSTAPPKMLGNTNLEDQPGSEQQSTTLRESSRILTTSSELVQGDNDSCSDKKRPRLPSPDIALKRVRRESDKPTRATPSANSGMTGCNMNVFWKLHSHMKAKYVEKAKALRVRDAKKFFVVRLYKLIQIGDDEDQDDIENSGKRIREFIKDRHYLSLGNANRAARDLQVEFSHQENPKSETEKVWQNADLKKLDEEVRALDPVDGKEGECWTNQFNGLNGDKFGVEVDEALLFIS